MSSRTPYTDIILIAVASTSLAYYAMLLGISLAVCSTEIFNLIGVFQPVILFTSFLLWPQFGAESLVWAASFAVIVNLAISVALWSRFRKPAVAAVALQVPLRELCSFGGWNFVVVVATAAMPVYTLQWLAKAGVDVSLIGCFSIAALIQGGLLTPANMAGPVVYNAWTKEASDENRRRSYSSLLRISVFISIPSTIFVAFVLEKLVPLLLGDGFDEALDPTWLLMLGVPLGYWAKLMANVLVAIGAICWYGGSAIARLTGVIIVLALVGDPTISDAAIAWVLGEVVQLTVLLVALKKALQWPITDILGFVKRISQ